MSKFRDVLKLGWVRSSCTDLGLLSFAFFSLQSVTGAKFVDDVNSYWVVKGPHGEHQCSRG